MTATHTDELIHLTGYRDVIEALAPPSKGATEQASYDENPLLQGAMVTLDDEPHERRRRVASEMFTADTVRKYEEELFPELAQRALEAFSVEEGLDLVMIAAAVQIQFAARFIGLSAWETVEEALALQDRVLPTMKLGKVRHAKGGKEDVVAKGMAAARAFEETHFRPAFEARRAALTAGGELPHDDMMNLLVAVQAHHPDLDDTTLFREALMFLNGAAMTSAATLIHVFDELYRWLQEHPEDVVRTSDLGFLQEVVYEAIRLHPVSSNAQRRIREEVHLSSGRVLHPGQRVALDLIAANRDRSVWGDDADEFRPGRERIRGVPPYGAAFGAGEHTCIGRVLAAGMPPRNGVNRRGQFGSITRTLAMLLEWGARPDPEREPQKDSQLTRDEYLSYPIVLTGAPPSTP